MAVINLGSKPKYRCSPADRLSQGIGDKNEKDTNIIQKKPRKHEGNIVRS